MAGTGQTRLTNAYLVRYQGGFTEVSVADGGYGRIEAFLSLGNVVGETLAQTTATTLLAPLAAVDPAITVGLEPIGSADSPWTGFDVGDTVTCPDEFGVPQTVEIVGITVTEDTEGNPIFVPTVGSLVAIREQRVANWLLAIGPGTGAGSNLAANPPAPAPAPQPGAPNPQILTFHWDGPVIGTLSDPQAIDHNGTLTRVTVTVPDTPVLAGPMVVEVFVTGVSIGTVTLSAGETATSDYFKVPVSARIATKGDTIQVQATTIATDATGMVAKITVI